VVRCNRWRLCHCVACIDPYHSWHRTRTVFDFALGWRRRECNGDRFVRDRLANCDAGHRLRPRGYLAGRLRIRWSTVHSDEVYFRDTAHGFLVWAVGVVITAAFLGAAVSSIVGSGAKLAATTAAAGAIAATASGGETITGAAPTSGPQSALATARSYLTDTLLRPDRIPAVAAPEARLEIGRIFAEALRKGTLPDADRKYAARLIAAQTGLSQAEAEQRVDAVYAQGKSITADAERAARDAADKARKAAAKESLWMFVALLTAPLARASRQRSEAGSGTALLSM